MAKRTFGLNGLSKIRPGCLGVPSSLSSPFLRMKQRTCEDEGRTTVSPDRAQIVAELVADVAARARAVLTSALSLKRCSGGLAVLELSSGASETIAASALVALKVRFGLWQLAAASPIYLDVKSELLIRGWRTAGNKGPEKRSTPANVTGDQSFSSRTGNSIACGSGAVANNALPTAAYMCCSVARFSELHR